MDIERSPKSALLRLLRESGRARPRALGFSHGPDSERRWPALVLVAEITDVDASASRAAIDAGASAIAFVLSRSAAADAATGSPDRLAAAVQACGDAVAGFAFPDGVEVPGVLGGRIAEIGIDFLIAATDRTPATLLTDETLALIARVDAGQPAALLRALGETKVGAVVAAGTAASAGANELMVSDLVLFKQLVECVRQPVLITVDQSIRPEDLQALRDAGVDGILIPAGASMTDGARTVRTFRDAIDKLKLNRRHGNSDGAAFLPTARAALGGRDDSDGDDED